MWDWKALVLAVGILNADQYSTNASGGSGNKSNKQNSPGAISSFSPGGQYIMLTFDGGPHAIITEKILNVLREKKVHATFFISGSRGVHNKQILSRIHRDGHELANNGWGRDLITGLQKDPIINQIRHTTEIVRKVSNTSVKYFRPFQGNTNIHINDYIRKHENLKVILWSLDSFDMEASDVKAVVENVVPHAKPGDVIVFHDTKLTLQALPIIIDQLYEKGYEFLTINQVSSFPDDSPHR